MSLCVYLTTISKNRCSTVKFIFFLNEVRRRETLYQSYYFFQTKLDEDKLSRRDLQLYSLKNFHLKSFGSSKFYFKLSYFDIHFF
jgi:hypothetical protein